MTETVVKEEVPFPLLDEERCPQCSRDYATCNCYDRPENEDFYDRDGNDGSYSNA